MANRTTRTSKKVDDFLTSLRTGLSINAACRAAGLARRTVYDWRSSDGQFRSDWDAAVEEGTDELEDVAVKRAKESSDTLLIFLLKARRPDKYKDRATHELTGKGGGPVQIADLSRLKGMTTEELQVLDRALVQIGIAEGDQDGTGEPEE